MAIVPPPIRVPTPVEQALDQGAFLSVSISGGKDSQALLNTLTRLHRARGWTGPIYAVHAHLGTAEWPQTLGHCEKICRDVGVDLYVVRRPQGDLLAEIRDRMEKLRGTGRPHWPSSKQRYCTSDQKRTPIDKVLRAPPWPSSQNRYCTSHQKSNQIDKELRQQQLVVSAMGLRADESPARARKSSVSLRASITSSRLLSTDPCSAITQARPGQRVALDWLPIHNWSIDDVWAACGTSGADLERRRVLYQRGDVAEALDGWPAHPAYVWGNQRLSCVFCILASRSDLINGARHNPEVLAEYVELEDESGFRFRADVSLREIAALAGVQIPETR